jgi:hypothetical protein
LDYKKYGHEVKVFMEVEPASGGKESFENSMIDLAGFCVYPDHPRGDKIFRAQPFSAYAERRLVYVKIADWTENWLEEISYFPEIEDKDQVDSASAGFSRVTRIGQDPTSAFFVWPPPPEELRKYLDQEAKEAKIRDEQEKSSASVVARSIDKAIGSKSSIDIMDLFSIETEEKIEPPNPVSQQRVAVQSVVDHYRKIAASYHR